MKEGQVESQQGASLHASHHASRHACLKLNWTFVGSRMMEKAAMQSYIC